MNCGLFYSKLPAAGQRGQKVSPTHRGHVDVVWVAWVVIGAGSCFGSLSLSCENKHREEWQ